MLLLVKIVGIVLILEGIPWFLSPSGTKKFLRQILAMPDRVFRPMGLAMMLVGLFLVYWTTG